ncbi:MAG: carboxylesterase family protein [Oscillospiraceae bacterium]|nr:carboxylesterase family protein [Oscillospiraceae bacterium]
MIKETRVENGWLRGIECADARVISYKGIPFAAPPVGDLRWHAPMPAEDWEGVLDCSRFGPISVQRAPWLVDNIYKKEWNVDPTLEMSEDSLTLNIWTPAKTTEDRLPVYVWYFGGGMMEGNPREMEFNGERLARRGIVVVTVNYRLNVFGLLAHPEITAENPEFPTNFGLLDQRFATMWVKRNIAAFGGDPKNITIGGQSGGGRSVQMQVVSPLNKDLFQRAIVMSAIRYGGYEGPNNHGSCRTLAEAEADGVDFFREAGIKDLAEARAMSWEEILKRFVKYMGLEKGLVPGMKMWLPVADGNFCTGSFSDLIITNKRNMVPLMFSNTADETSARPRVDSFEELETLAKKMFGDRTDEFLATVKADTLEETLRNATFSPMELGMRLYFEGTMKEYPEMKNYGALFDAEIPGPDHPGTFHSSDLWFHFESLAACWRPFKGKSYDLARQMANYVASFVKNGDPNCCDADGEPQPEWKPYNECRGPMHYTDVCHQEDDSFETPVMKFLVDYYLGTYYC